MTGGGFEPEFSGVWNRPLCQLANRKASTCFVLGELFRTSLAIHCIWAKLYIASFCFILGQQFIEKTVDLSGIRARKCTLTTRPLPWPDLT